MVAEEGTPEFQLLDGVLACQRQWLQVAIGERTPMAIMVVFRLAGIKEAFALCDHFGRGPGVALILVALRATPVEIAVIGDEIGTGKTALHRAMMVYTTPGLAAEEILVHQAVGTAILKIA